MTTPLVVLVSGAPASGKTVLASHLAEALDVSERRRGRQIADGVAPDAIVRPMERVAAVADAVTEPLGLGCEVVEVDTTDDYDPTLADIVERVRAAR